jgi:ABC transporter DrrB family efflux protein
MTRLRWSVLDGCTLAGRDLRHWLREPLPFVLGLLFPVLMMVMFGYVFGGAMAVPDGASYREFLMPGLFALTMAFNIETTFAAVTTDAGRGVMDRFRSLPMAPSALVVGRCTADMIASVLGLAVMAACGLLVGWRWHGGAPAALAGFGLLLLLRFALLWVGIWLALVLGSPTTLTALQVLVWPIGFFSNVFVSPATMPGWLGAITEWNPLSATTAAARELFGDPGWSGTSWAVGHATLLALAWPVLLTVVFFPLSVAAFRRLGG